MKILIGSNGGLAGIYLAKCYKLMKGITLFGIDSADDNTGRFFVDKQLVAPPASNPEFIEKLINILNKYEIDVYLPTHSKEIAVISKNEQILHQKTKTRFLVSPIETFDLLENKKLANYHLKTAGIPVPKLIDSFDCNYPILLKPDVGSGSNHIIIIENEEIHKAYIKTAKQASFYQFITGPQFTVDCMFDAKGQLIGANQRKRIKCIGGAVSITTNSEEYDIYPWISIFAKNWTFCGCVNFQYILHNNTPYFTDINLRYPSGGLPLTVKSGLNIPELTLQVLYNKPYELFVRKKDNDQLSMYRYFEEIFDK